MDAVLSKSAPCHWAGKAGVVEMRQLWKVLSLHIFYKDFCLSGAVACPILCVVLQYVVNCHPVLWTVWAVRSEEADLVSVMGKAWAVVKSHSGLCGAGAVKTSCRILYSTQHNYWESQCSYSCLLRRYEVSVHTKLEITHISTNMLCS